MAKQLLVVIILLAACVSVLESSAVRHKRSALTEDAEHLLRQANGVDVNNVSQLLDLVERNRAEECLARVICELTSNPKVHGESGSRFAQSLLKFRQSTHAKAQKYKTAMTNGAKLKNTDQCRGYYPSCTHSTTEVISVGNRILRTR